MRLAPFTKARDVRHRGSPLRTRVDAAGDVGEVEPDFDAAEVGAFKCKWVRDAARMWQEGPK